MFWAPGSSDPGAFVSDGSQVGDGTALAEVRRVLATADPDERAAVIAAHLRRLEEQLEQTRRSVASLRQLLQPQSVPVELRRAPALTVAAVEADVELDAVLSWYSGAMAELDAMVVEPSGPPGGVYDNELFTERRGHVLVYLLPGRRRAGPGAVSARPPRHRGRRLLAYRDRLAGVRRRRRTHRSLGQY